jgi:hypothetical protein
VIGNLDEPSQLSFLIAFKDYFIASSDTTKKQLHKFE